MFSCLILERPLLRKSFLVYFHEECDALCHICCHFYLRPHFNIVSEKFLSKNSTLIFRENCQFLFWVKNSWKCCGFGLFSCWQLWFHEKNCQKKIWVKNSGKCWGFVKIEFLDKNLTFRIVCTSIWCIQLHFNWLCFLGKNDENAFVHFSPKCWIGSFVGSQKFDHCFVFSILCCGYDTFADVFEIPFYT